MNRRRFLDIVDTLHLRYQFSETSGHRTVYRNGLVGGHPNSRHLLGLAMDIVLDDSFEQMDRTIALLTADAERLGIKAFDEGDHIHLQTE